MARQHGEVAGGDAATGAEAALATGGFLAFHFLNGGGQQSTLAQLLPYLARSLPFEHTLVGAAGGIESRIFEGGHSCWLVLACDAQDFLDGSNARQHLVAAVVADTRR